MSTGVAPLNWDVEVFYDGDCPLCVREIKLLRWLDRKRRIRFTDIAASDFQATEFGKTLADFMDEIHGRLPDENGNPGKWIIGVEVFRQLYAAVGFGPLVRPTRLPGISHGLDFGYRVFAKHRLRLTGPLHERDLRGELTGLALASRCILKAAHSLKTSAIV